MVAGVILALIAKCEVMNELLTVAIDEERLNADLKS